MKLEPTTFIQQYISESLSESTTYYKVFWTLGEAQFYIRMRLLVSEFQTFLLLVFATLEFSVNLIQLHITEMRGAFLIVPSRDFNLQIRLAAVHI